MDKFAVIFTSVRTPGDNGYDEMSDRLLELAKEQPGFLGIDSARQSVGITVSYWDSLAAIKAWKRNSEHLTGQRQGKSQWYESYDVKVCQVVREYSFSAL